MSLIGGSLAYRILRCIASAHSRLPTTQDVYETPIEKLTTHFTDRFFSAIKGRTVIDFGSGKGREAVEIAKQGAQRVIGIELQERFRDAARQHASEQGVGSVCEFVESTSETADIVFSLDSFEHFDDPADILRRMARLVGESGEVWISFGLPWLHPYGGHLFSVFPWAHLVFTESALIRWRSDFKSDGATRFNEVAGGLNQMTIGRFEKLVEASPLEFSEFRLTPIGKLKPLHYRWSREFTTSLIFARLQKVAVPGPKVPTPAFSTRLRTVRPKS